MGGCAAVLSPVIRIATLSNFAFATFRFCLDLSVIFQFLDAAARVEKTPERTTAHCGCVDHRAAQRRYISEFGRTKAGLLSFRCPAL
jgi:hypothetical protein